VFYDRSDTYFRLCSPWRAQYISYNILTWRKKQTHFYRTLTVRITNCATIQVQSDLPTVQLNRYIPHYQLCYRTGKFRITNCATEQVESALPTVLQNWYSLHYQPCYRTGTVYITNCATEQEHSALPAVLQNRYIPPYLKFSILATWWART